jgi:ElaB/YqjD/DUF883 family membrane-anchored ribosome-binding protein
MQNTYTNKETENQNNNRENKNDYISSMANQGEEKVKSALSEMEIKMKQSEEQLRRVATTVDKQLRENPWPVVGGVAAVCLLFGFIMGSKRNG